ncbi:hypothetical protein [Aneurinibacillus danicus]|nr:hypothetical protein [Aneurinibacillus danicus]
MSFRKERHERSFAVRDMGPSQFYSAAIVVDSIRNSSFGEQAARLN